MKVKPCNRHLLVEEATKEEKKKSTFILPEEFKVNKDPYKIVKVLSCADDCEKIKQEGIHIVVPSNMIEILDVFGSKYKIVQENYVNLIVEV